jgi:hypothetical protein
MSKSSLPQFRLCRVFTLGEEGIDTDLISDLVKNHGFSCEAFPGKSAKAQPKVKAKPKRRRRKVRTPLTAERIREFRKAREEGKSYRRIGNIFGVSDGRAWQIINQGK